MSGPAKQAKNFNPRPPRGERQMATRTSTATSYFNPRPPRGERRLYHETLTPIHYISIHALREESDVFGYQEAWSEYNFNPRPPRGERPSNVVMIFWSRLFQSTPSARRATCSRSSSRVETVISIHALREESDRPDRRSVKAQSYFNPRPPRGERHYVGYRLASFNEISIHALREESDVAAAGIQLPKRNFNPRPPRGERP